jgi:hypothetical protein
MPPAPTAALLTEEKGYEGTAGGEGREAETGKGGRPGRGRKSDSTTRESRSETQIITVNTQMDFKVKA